MWGVAPAALAWLLACDGARKPSISSTDGDAGAVSHSSARATASAAGTTSGAATEARVDEALRATEAAAALFALQADAGAASCAGLAARLSGHHAAAFARVQASQSIDVSRQLAERPAENERMRRALETIATAKMLCGGNAAFREATRP